VQTAHPEQLLDAAERADLRVRIRPRVGEHVTAGTVLAWAWPTEPAAPPPHPDDLVEGVHDVVRLGFERTLEQDAGLGIRQLADIACKALSPAVNDPYTAVQATEHLSVVLAEVARRSLGPLVVTGRDGTARIMMPGSRFDTYLGVPCGLIRRSGAAEPAVALSLLRLLATCGAVLGPSSPRWSAIEREAALVVADAEARVRQPADVVVVRERAEALRRTAARLGGDPAAETEPNG
jgi:uncharacterized membrane protein